MLVFPASIYAQCLSSVNPVGGTNNLLVLEKNSLRVISFYKFGQGTRYYSGTEISDFDLVERAFYNYWSTTFGYGLTRKLTLELESGYFFNKTQIYNLEPEYRLRGTGLSNMVLMAKHSLYTNPFKRVYLTGTAGAKIPFSRDTKWVNNVELPVELQPTMGAYGTVLNLAFVKENSGSGMRYFIISRAEFNGTNKKGYKPGNSWYNSMYVSKHLMSPKLKGDWTAIFQIRNEFRQQDKIDGEIKISSGSNLFFVAPQLNYVYKEQWYISAMTDIPVFQNFKGTQLGAGVGFTFIVSRTFQL
jgi:hypothetical protein